MNFALKNPIPDQKEILIVDDAPPNLRLLSQILTKHGYNVRQAINGELAISCCEKFIPDLILLDIMMPELDGYEVCQRLKQNEKTSKIPVIFLSVLNDAFDKVRAFEVGGVDYITQPFQEPEVIVRVQNQLMVRLAEIKMMEMNTEIEERVLERTLALEKANQDLKEEIVERQQLQNQLLYLAQHDSLTSLPNRALLMERLVKALKQSQESLNYQFGVLFLDCDRFKVINDSLGHLIGDELLIAIARRLETILGPGDLLARLGGDEFVLFLAPITDISCAALVAQHILKLFSEPFQLSRHKVFINVSIGIALSHTRYQQPEYLLRDADTAMYQAKALGKGRYHIFDYFLYEKALKQLQLENDLRSAVKQQEFIVYYQPIVSLITGSIAGFEALIRWQHPDQGLVSPAEFIPVAEEIGLIVQIDLWVLQEACRQLQSWQTLYPHYEHLTMSVNLSSHLFLQSNLIETIDDILEKTQLNPRTLKLEITETAIMEDRENTQHIFNQLKHRNIQLSMDDFGTGYSSLSYLHHFPLDILKIDQSFVKGMVTEHENTGLVPITIQVAHSLKMSATAEGIETYEQLAKLRDLGCDFGQGYFFSKPLEPKLASELLTTSPQW